MVGDITLHDIVLRKKKFYLQESDIVDFVHIALSRMLEVELEVGIQMIF